MTIHVVRSGETIESIAQQYGVVPAFLAADNGVGFASRLVTGQALVVRRARTIHTVEAGETVYSIARDYGISVLTLFRRNYYLQGLPTIRVGDLLVIDYADEEKLGTIGVNAYAYPYISVELLDSTLPYLTYLTPFTYGIGFSTAQRHRAFDGGGNLPHTRANASFYTDGGGKLFQRPLVRAF